MGFLKKLANLFMPSAGGANPYAYWVEVQCNRCGEVVRARVDLRNDLSPEFDAGDVPVSYYCRKVLIGEKQCFNQIELVMKFDSKRKLIDQTVSGGKLVEEDYTPARSVTTGRFPLARVFVA